MQIEPTPDRSVESAASSLSWLALLMSGGTLVCCALPIALVSLGFGTAVAALTSAMPVLVTVSVNKHWIFLISGIVIALCAWLLFRPGRACLADPALAARCDRAHRLNKKIFWLSASVWGIGFVAAYLLLPIRIWLDA